MICFNDESKTLNFIKKIIEDTKNKKILWDCVLNNLSLKENIYYKEILDIFNDKYIGDPSIVQSDSFFAEYNSGYFFLFKIIKEDCEHSSSYEYYKKLDSEYSYYILALQTGKESEIILVNELEEFQKELFTLFNILIRKHLKIDNFIDKFLNDK